MRHATNALLLALLLTGLAACGGEEAAEPGQNGPAASVPVEGMPSRTLGEDELALVGRWTLTLPAKDGVPGPTIALELFDGGAQRFTVRNAPGTEPGTVQTNEGVWWLEGLDRLLLSPRRSQGKDLPAGSAPETALRITEAGLLHPDAPSDQPLVRQER